MISEFSRKVITISFNIKFNYLILNDNRTKTDTSGQVENTKALEIIILKELGKMAP